MDILLVDDHAVIRTALKLILKNLLGALTVEEAFDAESALQQVKRRHFSMIIMDVSMPNTDSLTLMQNILALQPDAKILIFSMNPENIYAKRYLRMGAKGYVRKDASEDEIRQAILCVLNNRRYISSTLAEILAAESFSERQHNPFDDLSAREFEVLQHLLKGQSASEVCQLLYLSASTVSSHKNKILQKLGVKTLVEVNRLAETYHVVMK